MMLFFISSYTAYHVMIPPPWNRALLGKLRVAERKSPKGRELICILRQMNVIHLQDL
jgi:hypothetical protein